MTEQTKKQQEEQVDLPVITEFPCWKCAGCRHTLIGLHNLTSELMLYCQDCGAAGFIKTNPNIIATTIKPTLKKKTDYVG